MGEIRWPGEEPAEVATAEPEAGSPGGPQRGRARGLLLDLARRFALMLVVAGAIVAIDQCARLLAQAHLPFGVRVPVWGDRVVLERADDFGAAAVAAALRLRALGGLAAILATTALAQFMGGYGMSLMGAFGLILGGSASNQLSWLTHGFVLNWIGYRVDGPVTVMTVADFAQMAGLAVIISAMTLFAAVSVVELGPGDSRGSGGPARGGQRGLGMSVESA